MGEYYQIGKWVELGHAADFEMSAAPLSVIGPMLRTHQRHETNEYDEHFGRIDDEYASGR
jgi:hypothetical protein